MQPVTAGGGRERGECDHTPRGERIETEAPDDTGEVVVIGRAGEETGFEACFCWITGQKAQTET